jgi:hypothetical protein
MKITTKGQMYNLLLSGRLGNYARAWTSADDVLASGYSGEVSLRAQKIGDPVKLYHVPVIRLRETLRQHGLQDRKDLVFSEAPPDDKRVIQGELAVTERGLYLNYTFAKHPMRIAFREESRHAYGATAVQIVRDYVDPPSLDDLWGLLDDYPGAVVEFSTFRVPVGVMPHRRTLIWEVRHY